MGKAEKIIKDRLNELKSKLSQETSYKLDKKLNQMRIYALSISIQELEWLIEKNQKRNL